jgi:hypothetical protein
MVYWLFIECNQDSVPAAISACSQSSGALTSKLKSLSTNAAKVTKARVEKPQFSRVFDVCFPPKKLRV